MDQFFLAKVDQFKLALRKLSFIRKIKRGNRIYLAEVENNRDGVKVRQKLIRYLGLDPTCLQNDIPFKINDLKVGPVNVFGPVIALERHSARAWFFRPAWRYCCSYFDACFCPLFRIPKC